MEGRCNVYALSVALVGAFLFSALDGTMLLGACIVRGVFVFLGVGFAAPYHHWAQAQVPAHLRYTIVSLAGAIGGQCLGRPSAAFSLWLYQVTGLVAAPAFFLVPVALLAFYAIRARRQVAFAAKS